MLNFIAATATIPAMTAGQLIILVAMIVFVTILGVNYFNNRKLPEDQQKSSADMLMEIRLQFVEFVKDFGPVILTKDTEEGRAEAYKHLDKLFKEFIRQTDKLLDGEKELLLMLDTTKLLYSMEDFLIEQGILRPLTKEEVIEEIGRSDL